MTDESNHFAVVGTDTGVGKTLVTAGLVGWLRETGVDATAIKPAQTGYPPDDDAATVAAVCDDDEAAVCLDRLEPPLAPAVAARVEGRDISYEAIRDGCQRHLESTQVGIVEGIGGIRVPLADGNEVVDLVADLGVQSVVVSRSGLGTLNHTALTVDTLQRHGVPVHGVVLNRYAGETVAERTNPGMLESMTGVPVWTLPEVSTEPPRSVVGAVRESLPREAVPPL